MNKNEFYGLQNLVTCNKFKEIIWSTFTKPLFLLQLHYVGGFLRVYNLLMTRAKLYKNCHKGLTLETRKAETNNHVKCALINIYNNTLNDNV